MRVLILGSNGQLGTCLEEKFRNYKYEKVYLDKTSLDLTDFLKTRNIIKEINPGFIINATAYTAVDKAEEHHHKADLINHLSVKNLSFVAKTLDSCLIHISTDYVFNGQKNLPYVESDYPDPQGNYGKSKLRGELAITTSGCRYIIIRTAWLFSEHGNNFLRTILSLSSKKEHLDIVGDQTGCPTYCKDLAYVISCLPALIDEESQNKIYHYAGNESCSWFEFAEVILSELREKDLPFDLPILNKIKSSEYPTLAKRPSNSQLNSSLFEETFNLKSSNWREGVKHSINSLELNR